MKKLVLTIALVMCIAATGCIHKVNSSNPAVVKAVNANNAAKVTKTLADAISAANTTVESLQTQEPDYYAKVKPWLVKLAKANDTAVDGVTQYQAGTITFAKVSPALQSVATIGLELDPTTFGFKNPTSQAEVTAGLKLLQAALASVAQQFGTGQ